MWLAEKPGTRIAFSADSLFSAVRFAAELSRNTGIFRAFRGEAGGISLQLRLVGGESAIR